MEKSHSSPDGKKTVFLNRKKQTPEKLKIILEERTKKNSISLTFVIKACNSYVARKCLMS